MLKAQIKDPTEWQGENKAIMGYINGFIGLAI
jgi:hypothetical protein